MYTFLHSAVLLNSRHVFTTHQENAKKENRKNSDFVDFDITVRF